MRLAPSPGLVLTAAVAVVVAILATGTAAIGAARQPLYKDPTAPIEQRVEDLLKRMTLAEKLDQLGGDKSAMATPDNERLGIPGFRMADGPNGVRWGKSTAFPTGTALGATWDPDLVRRVAAAMGREFRAKGRYVALGPCINLIRDPRGGRSFETFSEDPYLLARLAVAYVRGMQSEKVIATAKHYACNNQENGRGSLDVHVPERTLREVYLPHFRACVIEGQVGAIMSAYNLVRGEHCTQNRYLQVDILKKEWGFQGIVMSDWGATHATVEAINGGLDVEMPHRFFYGKPLEEAVRAGKVSEKTIDEAVRRILRVKFQVGAFENLPQPDESKINTPATQALVRDVARRAIVLLKNERHLLPLERSKLKRIAVIGPQAAHARWGGGGSSHISPYYAVSPLDGIKAKVGDKVTVTYAEGCAIDRPDQLPPIDPSLLTPDEAAEGEHGLTGEYFDNQQLQGQPKFRRLDTKLDFNWAGGAPAKGFPRDHFSVRWRGKLTPRVSGRYTIGLATDDGCRLYLDGKRIINDWHDHAVETRTATVDLVAGRPYDLVIEYYENGGLAEVHLGLLAPAQKDALFREAVQAAADADVAIVCVGTTPREESEGHDRPSIKLLGRQDELVREVWRANRHTVVLVISGSAVAMDPWVRHVPAILQCWFNGQEAGNAIADVLFGDYNPGGKLPLTFPHSDAQLPPFDANYEAVADGRGYRYFDAVGLQPLFPFGYGLSYTRFAYSNLRLSSPRIARDGKLTVRVDVTNVGRRAGDEVVQLYLRALQPRLPWPPKVLRGFRRVSLKPGERKTISFVVGPRELAVYDPQAPAPGPAAASAGGKSPAAQQTPPRKGAWVVAPGTYEVIVGASSRDLRGRARFTVE
ncbi:MAG: glycoside hydrolase family 3 C-terminal domain-containing protein [Armatimonadetes bacterium]|nr:glycoside hydrolase family 3 C-terminal domain-containing protein [Armatimonadota bacterium]